MKILPLGGLGEIGMNCMVLESEAEILIVDCGLLFSDLDHFGVEFVIPDFTYLRERKDKIKGFLITHGHEDHIGAIPFALKAGIRAPIYASEFSSLLIKQRLREHGLESAADIRPFKMGDRIEFKDFKVQTVSVNHSIIDAAALIIDTPIGKVVHTGDFKIDATPFYGQQIDEGIFRAAGDDGVVLLLSDSTNVERHTHNPSENVIHQRFEQLFAAAEGLTVIAMFASNVSRIGQIFDLAKKMGKRVAVGGRSMDQNVRLAQELGYLTDAPSVMIAMDDIASYKRSEVIVLTSGSQAEPGSSLIRASVGEHRQLHLTKGDLVLMSSRTIPGNEKAIGRMINQLFKQGAEVLYEAVHEIHVSGHATRPELKRMLEWTRPKFFVPIHGEHRHLVHHARLAAETGVPEERILTVESGDIIELTADKIAVVGHLEEPRVLIENRDGTDISKALLKDRRNLAERGVVFCLMVRNIETRRIMSGPEIIARGVTNESMESWLIEEGRNQVRRIIIEYDQGIRERGPEMDLEEEVRVGLRRFFGKNIGKKPTVIPVILDL